MDNFAQQINLLFERVNALQQQTHNDHCPRQNSSGPAGEDNPTIDGLEIALEELNTALEELRVAEAELQAQNEELVIAHEAVEVERQRYQDLFEFAPDGYLVTDIAGTIQEANYAAAEILNLEQRFLVGKPLINFIGAEPEGSPEVKSEARRVFRGDLALLAQASQTQNWEVCLQPRHHRNGTDEPRQPINALMTVAPVLNRDGRVVALRWILRDITERKQAEAQVHTLNAELEQRVRDRTAQLAAANQLKDELLVREQAARAEAEAANRMKDEFLATISHELRTPLNAVFGWVQLLQTRRLDEAKSNRALEIIERNTKLQTQLVSDLLDVSRIFQVILTLSMVNCELVSVIVAAFNTVHPAAEAKRIKFRFSGPGFSLDIDQQQKAQVTETEDRPSLDPSQLPAKFFVQGDPDRLQQVVWNLLSNAIKFTPPGGCIEVVITRSEKPPGYIQLQVRDTGMGISPEFLPYVFDRFRQADSTSTRAYSGLGLGLAIVRHLVELHGGTVEAKSPGEGQGAAFIVELPLAAQNSSRSSKEL